MAKSYLITVHDDKVTGTQIMKVLQKLGCFVEMKDLSNDETAQPSVQRTADDDPQPGSLDYWASVTSKNSGDDRRR